MDIAWMAWTWPTAIFFMTIALMLTAMTVWQIASPTVERVGVLGIPTTRGDRLFITLLGSAFINLAWLGIIGPELWWAVAVSALYGLAVFRWV
jgi:predicted small integral membrane protein